MMAVGVGGEMTVLVDAAAFLRGDDDNGGWVDVLLCVVLCAASSS